MHVTALSQPFTDHETPLRDLIPAWRPPASIVPLWEQHAPAYLNALRLSVRPATAWTYLEVLSRFIRFLQDAGVDGRIADPLEATRADVEAFLTRERTGRRHNLVGERAAGTMVTERAGLRRYFAWAQREGLRPDNPTNCVAAPRRQPYRDVRALSADEARRLIGSIPVRDLAGRRLRLLAIWFLVTGRRHSEVLRRAELGLSQEELARESSLHWSYLGQVERGQRNLTLHSILKLAEVLGVDPADLVRGLRAPQES